MEKIIEYLEEKIANLKGKLSKYDSPIMQDMAKSSTHLQMDYIRLSSELQANEDNLLAIRKFAGNSNKVATEKNNTDGNQRAKSSETGKRKVGTPKKNSRGPGMDHE